MASPRKAGAAIPGLMKWMGNDSALGNHNAVAVTSFDEPSEYSAMAVYRGESPGETSIGPSMRTRVTRADVDGGPSAVDGPEGVRLQPVIAPTHTTNTTARATFKVPPIAANSPGRL